jgi:negative elongation factor A
VRLFASLLSNFPSQQTISYQDDSDVNDVLMELNQSLINNSINIVPQELTYLNKAVLDQQIDFNYNEKNHFTLRHMPRASSQLKSDVLHRAEIDFSSAGSLIRDRVVQRQSSVNSASSSFVNSQRPHQSSSSGSSSSNPKTTSLMMRRHREKGTKLLEIDEVPLSGRRKRRVSDLDAVKKVGTPTKLMAMTPPASSPMDTPSDATPTPDYATALADSSIQPHIPTLYNTRPVSMEMTHPLKVVMATPSTPGPTTPVSTAAEKADSLLAAAFKTHSTMSAELIKERQKLIEQMKVAVTTPLPTTPTQPVAKLKLNRQQLSVAQEIFREAPQLTKQQKALILAFMAGSRDNPLPGHDVISLKLNQRQEQEEVKDVDGQASLRNVQLETIFEMNYKTGQWRKLQVKRPIQT